MKVLMVERFLPDSVYTLELGRELKKYCDLTVFCKKNAGVQESGITWIQKFYPDGKGKATAILEYGETLLKLFETIRKGNFDIVHVQGFKDDRIEMKLYCGLRKYYKKLIYTAHNVLPHEADSKSRALYKSFCESCDGIIAHNISTKKCLMEELGVPEKKISVIPHGAYMTQPAGLPPQEDKPVTNFLQFGLIRKYKGIDILLDAVGLIPTEKRKNLHFVIAGRHYKNLDDTDYNAKIQSLGLENCVEFLPEYVPSEKLSKLFGEADFAVFPYRNIYGSGALLMAYTYGKPVIASNIPTFCEETDNGRTGLLFESENPQLLADAIIRASELNTEQVREYKHAIRELVEEKYNWSKSAQKTAELYKK